MASKTPKEDSILHTQKCELVSGGTPKDDSEDTPKDETKEKKENKKQKIRKKTCRAYNDCVPERDVELSQEVKTFLTQMFDEFKRLTVGNQCREWQAEKRKEKETGQRIPRLSPTEPDGEDLTDEVRDDWLSVVGAKWEDRLRASKLDAAEVLACHPKAAPDYGAFVILEQEGDLPIVFALDKLPLYYFMMVDMINVWDPYIDMSYACMEWVVHGLGKRISASRRPEGYKYCEDATPWTSMGPDKKDVAFIYVEEPNAR